LGVLSLIGRQPSMETMLLWIDFDTEMLLFGMMILVGICAETGAFEWAAVKAYKISHGNYWRLLGYLCLFTAVVSAFLDNVTTILLIAPVTVRICNSIGVDPIPILIAEVVYCNLGGAGTAIGDPPNIMIVSSDWTEFGPPLEFAGFTLHMGVGIIFVSIPSFFFLRLLYRNVSTSNPDPPDLAELKGEIRIWEKTMHRLTGLTEEEQIVKQSLANKIKQLQAVFQDAYSHNHPTWEDKVRELERNAGIKDKKLLQNCIIVMSVVIILFFIHSSVPQLHLDLGWIAILGAMALLLVSGARDVESLLSKIDWATLVFFAGLFILMEALGELGLLDFIGKHTTNVIKTIPHESRLSVGMILILWMAALASALIDNIPFTSAMIPILKTIASDPEVKLPLRPLIYAYALGACLGGNGTLIGASANVVCAGLAEQAGYPISFMRFFKTGFPMMLISTFFAMLYLLICHSAIGWND